MFIVLDTSVLIASLLSQKASAQTEIVSLLKRDKNIVIFASKQTLFELKQTIAQPAIKFHSRYNAGIFGKFVAWYQYRVQMMTVPNFYQPISRDVSDNVFLTLATHAHAHFLLSLDNDLLSLKNVETTHIVTPAEFIKLYSCSN